MAGSCEHRETHSFVQSPASPHRVDVPPPVGSPFHSGLGGSEVHSESCIDPFDKELGEL